jgi:hypothetical protein
MNAARKRFWQARARGQLSGYASYGEGTKATLRIGLKAGLNHGDWREGDRISDASASSVVYFRRAKQIGADEVGLTAIKAEGRYRGEPTRAAFFRNVRQLAQQGAADLAQREVIVEWDAPRRRGRVDTATPTKAPPATDAKRFCKWVRQHSPSARRDPRDACYTKGK